MDNYTQQKRRMGSPSLLDELKPILLCQQSRPNVQLINSWCVSNIVIMAKNKMQGGVRKFLPNKSFQHPEFLPPLPFFLKRNHHLPPAKPAAPSPRAALSAFSGLGARASWLWPQRVALEREETLAFFHGMENLQFGLHWKKVFFCFFF